MAARAARISGCNTLASGWSVMRGKGACDGSPMLSYAPFRAPLIRKPSKEHRPYGEAIAGKRQDQDSAVGGRAPLGRGNAAGCRLPQHRVSSESPAGGGAEG